MTTIVCDGCGERLEVDSLENIAEHPTTSEALCGECRQVRCHHCSRRLDVDELTSSHVHEKGSDTFVCDTCPRVEFPYEFTVTFRREPEAAYPPAFMDEIYPDVSSNPEGLPREMWRWTVYVTYRMTSRSNFEIVDVEAGV